MLRIRDDQMQTIALRRFAERLNQFIQKSVAPPRSISSGEVGEAVFQHHQFVTRCGFDSEADFALYLIARLCRLAPDEVEELDSSIRRRDLSTEEKRYRLSAELDEAGIMAFGALENGE
jgi:hypothetical protein